MRFFVKELGMKDIEFWTTFGILLLINFSAVLMPQVTVEDMILVGLIFIIAHKVTGGDA